MPDSLTVIPADLEAKPRGRNRKAATSSRSRPFLNADQMRALWLDVESANKNWDANDEKRSGAIATAAFDRIADARTVDPIGIGYKLLATRQWPRDRRKGLADDLGEYQHDLRSVARIIKDLGVLDHAAGLRPTRPVPSRLRPIWDAYQSAWKGVSDVMDEEDAAMVARPNDAAPDSTDAEKAAKAKRANADKAFEAASEAFEAAPTRTFDDALCRIEYALDQVPPSDIAAALTAALRVLRKTGPAS